MILTNRMKYDILELFIRGKGLKMKSLLSSKAKILSGTDLKRPVNAEENGNIFVVTRDDIDEYNVLNFKHTIKMFSENINEEKFLKDGDILFVIKGAKRIASVVRNVPNNSIAVPSFCIIRLHNQQEISPEFLTWYLNQESVKASLNQFLVGVTIPSIQKKALDTLEIPVIEYKEQQRILNIANLLQKEQKLMKDLLVKKDLLVTQRLLARVEA